MVPSKKTILVTDSGLGGMSVFARMAGLLARKSPWQNVSMIYFNAWPEQDRGYNHLKTMEEKARVFTSALNAMERFNPDMIFIACNTLSVIYPFTAFSRNTGTTVTGIVDLGVQLIHKHLLADPDSRVILFGTPTTIAEKSHELKLVKKGIDPDRISGQGCTDLAGKIERDPFSSRVPEMIRANVTTAVSKIHHPVGNIHAALCCTHFGYCKDLFYNALSENIKGNITILSPNESMADQVSKSHDKSSIFSPDIRMQVVSRVFWEPGRIDAYARLLNDVSLKAVKALAGYEWNPDLFEV